MLLTDEFTDLSEHNIGVFKQHQHPQASTAHLDAQTLVWGGEALPLLPPAYSDGVDFVLGSDITYDKSLHPQLLDTLAQLCSYGSPDRCRPGPLSKCECLLSIDLDSPGSRHFLRLARERFHVELSPHSTYAYCVGLANRAGNHRIDYLSSDDEDYCVARMRLRV